MRGIAFHWESPWRDIYSGLDAEASAWRTLASAFQLDLLVIERNWPFPVESDTITCVRSMDEALEHINGAPVALAQPGVANSADLQAVDWLVLGPSEGWRGRESGHVVWSYEPSPKGGFHALHLAHIAAHVGR